MTTHAKVAIPVVAFLATVTALLVVLNRPEVPDPEAEELADKARIGSVVMEARRRVGTPVPELSFRLISDDSGHHLSDFRGRVVLLNIWSTSCGPCRAEMPALSTLQRKHGPKDLAVITLTFERPSVVREASRRQELALPPLSAYSKRVEWVPGTVLPMTFLVDREGIIRRVDIGRQSEEELGAAIEPYL